jgi:hypothetical protein
MNELIIVKQLPVIEENLKALKDEIETKASRAMNLVCTEDTVKEVKSVRADLNKEFTELEEQRKLVKAKVLEPYEAFEKVYKDCVSEIYKKADKDLKSKIDEVEDGLRKEKEEKVIEYFVEYQESRGIDFVTFGQANIKVGLSDSLKSLKDKSKAFIDKICEDLDLIKTQEHKEEILVEYEKTLNASQAITTVVARHKALEAMQEKVAQAEVVEAKEQERVAEVEKVAELSAPIEKPIDKHEWEKKYKARFEVIGRLDQLKAVKDFMEANGIQYLTKS